MGRKRKLTEEQVGQILFDSQKGAKTLAQEFSVSIPTIYNVLSKKKAYNEETTSEESNSSNTV